MKHIFFIISTVIAFGFAGCGTKTANSESAEKKVSTESMENTVNIGNTNGIFSIDLSKSYSHKKISLQSIADIEYVALETSYDILLDESFRLSSLSDKYIVGWQSKTSEVFIFNRDGKFVSRINKFGQSGAEYTSNTNTLFDEKNEEVFVVERSEIGRIQVYTLNGEYKRTLNYSKDFSDLWLYNFDDETLLIYVDDERSSMTKLFISTGGKTPIKFVEPERPYMLMSKKDGVIVDELNIVVPERYALTFVGGGLLHLFRLPYNRYHGQDFVIADMSHDTIYQLSKSKELTPLFIRKPPVSSSDPLVVWSSMFITDKFSILHRAIKNNSSADAATAVSLDTLMHNLSTGEINKVSFINDDYLSAKWNPTIGIQLHQTNVVAGLLQMPELSNAYKEKQLKGNLEKFIATLQEDDNQIVMIVKFK